MPTCIIFVKWTSKLVVMTLERLAKCLLNYRSEEGLSICAEHFLVDHCLTSVKFFWSICKGGESIRLLRGICEELVCCS